MKKIIGLFIVGVLASAMIAGCGSKSDEGSTTPAATTGDTASTTGATAGAPTTPPATTADTAGTPPAATAGTAPAATAGTAPAATAGDAPKGGAIAPKPGADATKK